MTARKFWNDEVVSMTADAWEEILRQKKELEDRVEELTAELEHNSESAHFLNCLRAAGVDNWDGYDYACEIYRGDHV